MTGSAAVAAAVLTGGSSRRFGSDKVLARLGPRTLLERVTAALRDGGAAPLALVGGAPSADPTTAPGPGEPAPVQVPDDHPGEGPLGGVLTALRWSPTDHTVVVAADLPLLDALTVRALIDRAGRCPEAVAVARAAGRLQPTCACWPAAARTVLQHRFDGGERSIRRALDGLAVEAVDVPARVVADVDTPEDLARLAVVWSW